MSEAMFGIIYVSGLVILLIISIIRGYRKDKKDKNIKK